MCFRIAKPAISRVGRGGWPGLSEKTAPNRSSRNRQSICRPSLASAWFVSIISAIYVVLRDNERGQPVNPET
jgi:hypothetical protein